MIDLITKSLTGVNMMGTLIVNVSKLILLLTSWYLYLCIFYCIFYNHYQHLKYIFHVVFAAGIYATITRLNQYTLMIKNWSVGVVVCNDIKPRTLLHENYNKKLGTFLH